MKKVFGIVLLLVVLVSAMAFAVEPPVQANWSFKLTADDGSGTMAMAAGQIGVDATSNDGVDTKDTLPSFVVGNGTRGFGMVMGSQLYKNNYNSNKSPLDSAYGVTGKKTWDIRVFATPGTPSGGLGTSIRLYFGTTSLPLATPATVKNAAGAAVPATYTLKMVNNRGVAGAPVNGTVWNVPIPTAVSTNYFSITLPVMQLTAGNAAAAIAEGYVMEFSQTAPVPEPSSIMALGAGLMGLAGFAARRRRS